MADDGWPLADDGRLTARGQWPTTIQIRTPRIKPDAELIPDVANGPRTLAF
jgi:hypothetical protein